MLYYCFTFVFVFFMSSRIPLLEPPEDLPQFLPLDHNVELLRATEGLLSSAVGTSTSDVLNTAWDESNVDASGSDSEASNVVSNSNNNNNNNESNENDGSTSNENDVVDNDCPVLLNSVCFPIDITDPNSIEILSKPSAPRNIQATTIDGFSIQLDWDEPELRADTIIAYSIAYSNDSEIVGLMM